MVDAKLQALMDAPLQGVSTLRHVRPRGKHSPESKPAGYAATPGAGPAGKRCSDCKFDRAFSNGGKRSWHKCQLMQDVWTGGRRTDILARSPACRYFEDTTNGN